MTMTHSDTLNHCSLSESEDTCPSRSLTPEPPAQERPRKKRYQTRALEAAAKHSTKIPKRLTAQKYAKLGFCQKLASCLSLKYAEDFRTLAYLAGGGALFIYSWRNFYDFSWFLKVLAVLAVCFYTCASSLICHNVLHNSLFYWRPLNKLTQYYLTLSYGIPVSAYVPAHNLSHHHYPNRPKDVTRTTLVRYDDNGILPGNFWNLIMAGDTASQPLMNLEMRYLAMMGKLGRPFFYQAMSEIMLLLSSIILLAYQDWLKFLVLYHLPHTIASTFMLALNFMQHDGCDVLPSDDADQSQHPHISRNFVGRVFNLLFFNNGFHSVHHMHQTMHWTVLPEAHRAQYIENPDHAKRIDPRLDQENLLTYIWTHHLTKGRREMYDGRPVKLDEFPDHVDQDIFDLADGFKLDDLEYRTCGQKLGFLGWAIPQWFRGSIVQPVEHVLFLKWMR